MRMWTRRFASACLLALMGLGMASYAPAQDAPPPGGPGGPGGGPGRFDPAQMRQMMMDRMREQMQASDDEWKALEPAIQKVMDAQREGRAGGFGMRLGPPGGGRGPGGPPPGFGADSNSPVAKAAEELRSGLDDSNTNPQELAKRLAAFREAKEQARQKLAAAQKELKDLLTLRQEAVLLTMGMIE